MLRHDLTDIQLDLLSFEVIPEQWRVGEASLHSRKWWDYRHLHPMRATYLFAAAYETAYRRAYPKRGETILQNKIRVFRCDDPMRDGEARAVGLWRGRQTADQLGIPYGFYCSRALDWSERLDWTYLARPEDMYNSALSVRANEEWQNLYLEVIQEPKDPIFRGTSNVGPSFYQCEWEEELCRLIARKSNPRYALEHHLLTTGLLSETIARGAFGEELIKKIFLAKITHN